jgi:hypothetical protein
MSGSKKSCKFKGKSKKDWPVYLRSAKKRKKKPIPMAFWIKSSKIGASNRVIFERFLRRQKRLGLFSRFKVPFEFFEDFFVFFLERVVSCVRFDAAGHFLHDILLG